MEDGYYSIRPMHKLDMGLNYESGNVNITGIGTSDSAVAQNAAIRWKISYNSNGYVFMNNGTQSRALYPSGGSSSAGVSVIATTYSSSNTAFRWTMEKITSVPNQIHIYDSETGLLDDNAVRTIRPGQTLTLAALGIDVGVTSINSNNQNVSWSSADNQIASVNSSTGTVTAGSTKCKATTITATSALGVSTTYIICVTPVTLEPQPNGYWCWLATARMFATNYIESIDPSMSEVASDMNKSSSDGGSPEDIANAVNLFAETDLDIGYSTTESIITKSALVSSLDLGHVVGVCLRYPELPETAPGHALLVVAYTYVSGDYQFLIFDPGPANEGTIHMASYEQIQNGRFSYSFGEGNIHSWTWVVVSNEIWGIMSNRFYPT